MAVLNSDILTRAWLNGSNMFQQRIPNPSINSQAYHAAVENLFAPMNNDMFNEFSGLMNGLIGTYVDIKLFENPLRVLKKPAVGSDGGSYGFSERHVCVHFLQSHAGRYDDETLLKLEKPEYTEWFYSISEPRRYEFSWSRQEMAQAFAQDGYGFDDLLSATITQMLSSANYDEMQIMLQMFAEADKRTNGLYRYQLSAAPTDDATGRELLRGIRTVAGQMKFPTMMYNQIPVPVHENGDSLVVWMTPEVAAAISVETLAYVFNMSASEIQYRTIIIPEFPIPNVYAAVTSEDFIYYRDFMTGMEPPFYNPGNRTYKYYYWANGMIGFNPAANCVLFTTEEQTVIPTVTVTPDGLSFSPNAVNVVPGRATQLNLNLTGSVIGDESGIIAVEPDAALFSVVASRDGAPVALNSRTYVDAYGKLHVQKTGLEIGDIITVTAKSAYINPSGATNTFEATCTATVTAPENGGAKECSVAENPYIEYTNVTEEATASE